MSVIVPMYNVEGFIDAAVERLLSQTYDDIEVVLVDDCSTDATVEKARALAAADPRIVLVELAHNLGVAQARNRALEAARGEYLWFVDADDQWSDHFIERMIRAASDSGAQMVQCSAVHRFGARHQSEEYVVRYVSEATMDGIDATRSLLEGTGAWWNKLVRRDAVPPSVFPTLRSKSDHAGLMRMIPHVQRVAIVPDALYTYVQRDGSISNGGVPEPQNFLRLLAITEGQLAELPPSPELNRIYIRFHVAIVGRALRECWRFGADAQVLVPALAAAVTWRDLCSTLGGDRRAALTCAAAKASPRLARSAFRWLGRRRWTPRGGQ